MQTRSLTPTMVKHGMTAASAGLMHGAVTLVLTLALTAGYASFPPASSKAAEPSAVAVTPATGIIQQERVELVQELRAETLAEFASMEQAPGLYSNPGTPAAVQRDRVAAIEDLRSQNLADFDTMERAPGLFTHPSDATAAAPNAEIEDNLNAFDRMEQAPSLFTEVPKETELTHPWGGDALTPDY
jgi:hypothetical protein